MSSLSLRSLGRASLAVVMTAAMALPIGVAASTAASAGPVSPPTISSFTPTKGSFAGGTSVVITGSNLSGATAVNFGDSPAASFTVDSATQITAVTPSHAIGREVVSVTRGTTVTAPDDFVFQPEITLLHDFYSPGALTTGVPFFMTTGPDGNIWGTMYRTTTDVTNNYFRLEPDGTATTFTAPATVGAIQTIIAGTDGYLYSTGTDPSIEEGVYNRLLRIATDGTATTIIEPELCDAMYLTVGGDGNVWAVNRTVCAGASDFTVVRFNPDGSVTSFPVASGSSGIAPGLLFPISENRIFINDGEAGGYILDPEDGSVTTFVPCAQDPSAPLDPINGLVGPDGELWITCFSNSGDFFGEGYIARVELDPSDPDYLDSTYFDSNNTDAAIRGPIFMTIGADGNIWVSQLNGPAPAGSPLPVDLSGQLVRISFPDGYSDPLVEDFDSNAVFAFNLGSGADGYMYQNQFTILLYYSVTLILPAIAGCFQVTTPACTAVGLEGFDSIAGIYRIDVGTAGAPTLADPTPGTNEMQLSWTAPVNTGAGPITGYRIKYSRFADMSDATVIDTGNTDLSRTITSLSDGGRYYVRIATTNTIATGTYGPIKAVDVPSGTSVPDAPTALIATPGNSSASISFSAGADGGAAITKYQYSINDGGSWSDAEAGTTSPVSITGLTNGTDYSIKLRALNSVGDGTASAAVSVTPRTTPSAPTVLVANPGDGSASIVFSAGADGGASITKYQVKVGNGSWTDVVGTTSPITVTGLTNYVTVGLRLRAVNAAGAGATSGTVKVWPRISGPTLTSAAAVGRTSIRAAFAALNPSGGTPSHYWVFAYAKGTSNVVGSCRSTAAARNCVIKGLIEDTEYDVAVRGFFTLTGSPEALPTMDSTRETVRTKN